MSEGHYGVEEVTITLEALDWWYVVQALKGERNTSAAEESKEDLSFSSEESIVRLAGAIERQLLKGVVMRRLAQLPPL